MHEDDGSLPGRAALDPEVVAPQALALVGQEEEVRRAVAHLGTALELRWEEERRERERWKAEDKWDAFYHRLVALMASGFVCEGSAGNRPRADQVASSSVEYALAIMRLLAPGWVPPEKR